MPLQRAFYRLKLICHNPEWVRVHHCTPKVKQQGTLPTLQVIPNSREGHGENLMLETEHRGPQRAGVVSNPGRQVCS